MASAVPYRRQLLSDLRRRGFRITAQRKALIDTIQEADRHLDAATLLERARARNPRVNRATVYRTLELLKKQRLIDELDLMHVEGEKHYYEVRRGCEHVHLTCLRCGRVEEFTSPLYEELKTEMAESRGFDIQVCRVEAGGLCSSCATRLEKAE